MLFRGFDEDDGFPWALSFSPDGRFLVGGALESDGQVRVWETEGWRLVHTLQPPERPETLRDNFGQSLSFGVFEPDHSAVLTATLVYEDEAWQSRTDVLGRWVVRRWPLAGGKPELVGQVAGAAIPFLAVDSVHRLLAVATTDAVQVHGLDTLGREPPRVIGRYDGAGLAWGAGLAFDPAATRLAVCDAEGVLRVWPLDPDGASPEREIASEVLAEAGFDMTFSPDGSRLALSTGGRLWDLQGPAFAEPMRLTLKASRRIWGVAFTPDGRWVATSAFKQHPGQLALWPLSDRYPRLLGVAEGTPQNVFRFHPDGSRLFTVVHARDGLETLLEWPLTGGAGVSPTVLLRGQELSLSRIEIDRLSYRQNHRIRLVRRGVLLVETRGEPAELVEH